MLKLDRLRKEALESCEFRGHRMRRFIRRYNYSWFSMCKVCGKEVWINSAPAPNGIGIGGEAVAMHCSDEKVEK